MRRSGGRLILDAPWGAELEDVPHVSVLPRGSGDATFTLRLGRGVRFAHGVSIEVWARGTNVLEIGDYGHFSQCKLQLRSGSIRARDHVQVRDFSVLKSYGDLFLGSRVVVNYMTALHCEESVVIDDLVGMAERVTIVDTDKMLVAGDDYFNDRPSRIGPVSIGRNTYVGTGVVITRGARIGRNSAVAANAVVTGGEYPDGHVLGGIPAKLLKSLPQADPEQDQVPPAS